MVVGFVQPKGATGAETVDTLEFRSPGALAHGAGVAAAETGKLAPGGAKKEKSTTRANRADPNFDQP